MKTYIADDGNCEVRIRAASPEDAAAEYVASGDWSSRPDPLKTAWVRVYVWEPGHEDERDSYTVPIEPDEPECEDSDGHNWQRPVRLVGGTAENPGVWGHGGGIIIDEACVRCGCRRQTDTWAQDPDTGEQGLHSVKYTPGHYDIAESPTSTTETGQ